MGFFNMAQGDLPYLQSLAQTYSINDNYHQPFMGGSTVNGVAIGTAVSWFSQTAMAIRQLRRPR